MLIRVEDYQAAAALRLSQAAYDYYRGGARDELALARNRQAFSGYALHYRVMRGVQQVELASSVLGLPISLPILTAPTAFHGLADPLGEVATARATTAYGSVFILSTLSNQPMERVIQAASGPVFFQLYLYKDRGITRELVQRAAQAGAKALVLTVDAPVLAIRERDRRNDFRLPPPLKLANLTGAQENLTQGLSDYVQTHLEPALAWKDLDWLVQESNLPVVVKGIVRPDDALQAAQRGARAVVVSNHGGRQLDQAPASLHCLSQVRRSLPEEVEVWLDGGVRRGGDVLLARALGAQVVLLGRPILWGLAAAGEPGVSQIYRLLEEELREAMLLCGCGSWSEVGSDLVERL